MDRLRHGPERAGPAFQVGLAPARVTVLPGVVRRQVEFAGAPRNADPAADAHEPFVVRQRLACLARQQVQGREASFEFADDLVQHRFGNGWIAAITVEEVFLFFQVLHRIGLQVRARRHIHDFENRGECVVMIDRVRTRDQLPKAAEQVLQAQVGANAFVEGVFVEDHAVNRPWALFGKATNHSPKRRAACTTLSRSWSIERPSLQMTRSAAASRFSRLAWTAMMARTSCAFRPLRATTRSTCVCGEQSTTSTRSTCDGQRPDSTSSGMSNTMQRTPA